MATSKDRTKARHFKDLAALRVAVDAACLHDLTIAFGTDRFRRSLDNLRQYIPPPNAAEEKCNQLFARLRSAMIDAVTFARVRGLEIDAARIGAANRGQYAGESGRELQRLAPTLAPLLKHHTMRIPPGFWTVLDGPLPDPSVLTDLAETTKKRRPRWSLESDRARLVDVLDRLNLLGLPKRPDGTSRFLDAREFARVSLRIGTGVLDEPGVIGPFLARGVTAPEVIGAEEKRMRIAVKRHYSRTPAEIAEGLADTCRRGPD